MTSGEEFQRAIVARLRGDERIMALAGGVYDRVPASPFKGKPAYLSLGNMDTVEDDADCITGVEVTLQIDIWQEDSQDGVGSLDAKTLTDLVRQALHRKPVVLGAAALLDMWVVLTRTFRDGLLWHGVVQLTAQIEEP